MWGQFSISPNNCLQVDQPANIAPFHLLAIVPSTSFVFLPLPLAVCLPPASWPPAPGFCVPPPSQVAGGKKF